METIQLTRQETGQITVLPSSGGVWQVWERPRVHCRYLVSVRPGGAPKQVGGRTDRERSVILVLRKWWEAEGDRKVTPTRLVCRLAPPAVLDPTPLAKLVSLASSWYGGALTFVEVKDGPIAAKECQKLGVPVEMREVLDKATSEFAKELGWLTDDETGPAALNALVNAIREVGMGENGDPRQAVQVECPHVLGELETFSGDTSAPVVSHDDDVRALATGLYNIDAATMIHPERRPRVAPQDGWRVVDSFR